jgi:SAM-dependent methyltransferase
VHGIERSAEMVEVARSAAVMAECTGSFTCELGDICAIRLDRTFDAVISLFHVVSYQTTNQALRQTFDVAAQHLDAGGFFIFDVWHGPAVLMQGPSERVKEVADERYSVKRLARPEVDTNRSTVKVIYDLHCEDRASGSVLEFREEHLMRYLFPSEVDLLAHEFGLKMVSSEEFLTRRPPSPETWGVMYVLQKYQLSESR